MPQQRSVPGAGQSFYDDVPWDGDDETDELPPRPRRKLVTRTTLGFAAVLIGAGGFIGGVEVQKHQGGGSPSSSGLPAGLASRLGGGPAGGGAGGPGGGAASGDFTTGTVANKHGSTLYVKDQSGNTIRVNTSSNSKVTRTAAASPRGVYPGDTVVVTGTKHSDGSVSASSIRATSKTAASSGGGFFGGGLPGGGFGGGAQGGGGVQGGGPSAQVVPKGGG
jgi:hypothetical protein